MCSQQHAWSQALEAQWFSGTFRRHLRSALQAFCLSVAAGVCEHHVTLTGLCEAVLQINKSQQVPQAEKMIATLCHTSQ